MLLDAIRAARVSIFFVDEDQRITVNDEYDVETICRYAKNEGAILHKPYELVSQFRCDGSDGYIAFLNHILGLKETANTYFAFEKLDLKVFDDPVQMRNELRKLNEQNHKTRMVAGYCYDWNVKNHRGQWDIELENGFQAKWKLENDDHYAVNPDSFEEVSCIHTIQGMEFDYVGVIIGKDCFRRNPRANEPPGGKQR